LESTKQDKRTIVRRRTQQLVYLELGRENGGVMLNLSEQGCGFQAITPVKPGETRFAFQINGGRRIAGDAEVVWAAGARGGVAPRCARATPAAIPIVSKARPVAAPMVTIRFFILTRESLPHGPAFGERRPHVNCEIST